VSAHPGLWAALSHPAAWATWCPHSPSELKSSRALPGWTCPRSPSEPQHRRTRVASLGAHMTAVTVKGTVPWF
jgi:hypothetical protein